MPDRLMTGAVAVFFAGAILVTLWLTQAHMGRRRRIAQLDWPVKMSQPSFQKACLNLLHGRGCAITDSRQRLCLLKYNKITIFAMFETEVPAPFQWKLLVERVNFWRTSNENVIGLLVMLPMVPYELGSELAGSYIRPVQYKELASVDQVLMVKPSPMPPLPQPEMDIDAWNILRQPLAKESGRP